MNPRRPDWWHAAYSVNKDVVTIKGVSTNECPVSLITSESRFYLETFERSRVMRDQGIPLFGHDLSRWPPWAVDVVTVLTLETERTDRQLEQAVRNR